MDSGILGVPYQELGASGNMVRQSSLESTIADLRAELHIIDEITKLLESLEQSGRKAPKIRLNRRVSPRSMSDRTSLKKVL